MTKHETCPICSEIPDTCSLFISGGDVAYDDMPAATAKLTVVGAPFFKDEMSSSRTLIKTCPRCGAFYEWDYEYEFLVGGSEDSLTLTRLDEVEGQRRADQMLARVHAAERHYLENAANARPLLRTSEDEEQLLRAIDLFGMYTHLVQGFDIGFAIPDLIACLARVQALTGYERTVSAIYSLFVTATSNAAWSAIITDAIDASGNTSAEAQMIRRWAANMRKSAR